MQQEAGKDQSIKPRLHAYQCEVIVLYVRIQQRQLLRPKPAGI